jgi:uncharacterized lipoprotein YehR (DUF1307 family)
MNYSEPEQKLEPDFDAKKEEISEIAFDLVYKLDKIYDYISSFFEELNYSVIEEKSIEAQEVMDELESLYHEWPHLEEEYADGRWRLEEIDGLLHQKELEDL